MSYLKLPLLKQKQKMKRERKKNHSNCNAISQRFDWGFSLLLLHLNLGIAGYDYRAFSLLHFIQSHSLRNFWLMRAHTNFILPVARAVTFLMLFFCFLCLCLCFFLLFIENIFKGGGAPCIRVSRYCSRCILVFPHGQTTCPLQSFFFNFVSALHQ